jgi:hypothetical protein
LLRATTALRVPALRTARTPNALHGCVRLTALWIAALAAVLGMQAAHAQQFTSTPVTEATVGQPYVYEVVFAGAGGTGTVIIDAAASLPPWLSLTPTGNGTATLSGTPTVPGSVQIVLRARYGVCARFVFLCPTQAFTITIGEVANAPPVVVPPGIADRTVSQNELLTVDVAAAFSDPDGDPLTFAATGLPAGFTLVGSVISGMTTGITVAGSPYNVSVTATDGRGGSVADAFVLAAVPLSIADVFLSGIEATPSPATVGGSVTWVVTVGNNGPSPSGSVSLGVQFAGNPFTFTANPCTATAAVDRQELACTVGPIGSGATQTVTITGAAAQAGDVYVTANVASGADANTGNNAAAASLNVAEVLVTDRAQSIAVGAPALAAGDLNGDGYGDVVLAAPAQPPALLLDIENPAVLDAALLRPGDERRGLASMPLSFGVAATSRDVAVVDIDGDQQLDAVVVNGPGVSSTVFRGDGTGVLSELMTLGPAARDDRAVAAADLNGDGYIDVVIASAGSNALHLNQNGVSFQETALPAHGSAGAVDVVLADVVGSTLPDVVFVYAGGPTVRHENLGGGSFGAAVEIDAGPTAAAASADFNGDGRADLVLARTVPGAAGLPSNPVYLNDGAGGLTTAVALGAAPTTAVLTGDVNGDGTSDIVAINATGAHQLFVGDGNGNFSQHPRVLVSRGAAGAAIAPFGRAQHPDLVLAGSAEIHVFFNDGAGNFGLGDTSPPTITLNGAAQISMEVSDAYADPGATASDDVDGALTPAVTNPVDPAVIGTYTVTYTARDNAGNTAVATRAVDVTARAPEGGGGGGAASLPLLVLLLAALARRRIAQRLPS